MLKGAKDGKAPDRLSKNKLEALAPGVISSSNS